MSKDITTKQHYVWKRYLGAWKVKAIKIFGQDAIGQSSTLFCSLFATLFSPFISNVIKDLQVEHKP